MSEDVADGDPLKSLLDESGLISYQRGPGIHSVLFSGALRPWAVDVRTSNGWICMRVQMMTLPKADAAKNALLDAVARLNDRLSLVKAAIAWGNQLVFDLQYLTQHVDAQTLSKLVWLIESLAEREYPSILDVARSSEALDGLEDAFKRSPAA